MGKRGGRPGGAGDEEGTDAGVLWSRQTCPIFLEMTEKGLRDEARVSAWTPSARRAVPRRWEESWVCGALAASGGV